MAAILARRPTSTIILSTSGHISAYRCRTFSFRESHEDDSFTDTLDIPMSGLADEANPDRRWCVHKLPVATNVRLNMPGFRLDEIKVWLEYKAVVIEGNATAKNLAPRRCNVGGVILLPPEHMYGIPSICGMFYDGYLTMSITKKDPELDEPNMEFIEIKFK